MDIFNGNRLLEERVFNSLNWGLFLRDTTQGLNPFVFAYKDKEKVKTLMLEKSEDDFEFAINCLKKADFTFDQFVVGYQTQMQLDKAEEPINVIVAKGFDTREDNGVFFIQQFDIDENKQFIKIKRFTFLGAIPLPLNKFTTDTKDVTTEQGGVSVMTLKDGDKVKPSCLIRQNSESDIGDTINNFLITYLQKYDELNLSGNFSIDIQARPNIHKDFLIWIVKNSFYDVITSEFVVKNFTRNKKGISLKVYYSNEVIFEDTTNDAVEQLNELFNIMDNVSEKNIQEEAEKKWWQF